MTQLNIARYWLVRITETFQIIGHGPNNKKKVGYRSLFYLFGGVSMASLDWNLPQLLTVKSDIVGYLFKSMEGIAYKFIHEWYGAAVDDSESDGTWKGADPCDDFNVDVEELDQEKWFRKQIIDIFGKCSIQSTNVDISLYKKACFYRAGHQMSHLRYKHQSITHGDGEEILLDQSQTSRQIKVPSSNRFGRRIRVLIRALVSVGTLKEIKHQLYGIVPLFH